MLLKTIALAALTLGVLPLHAAPLKVEVMQTSVNSLYTSITLIEGKKSAICRCAIHESRRTSGRSVDS